MNLAHSWARPFQKPPTFQTHAWLPTATAAQCTLAGPDPASQNCFDRIICPNKRCRTVYTRWALQARAGLTRTFVPIDTASQCALAGPGPASQSCFGRSICIKCVDKHAKQLFVHVRFSRHSMTHGELWHCLLGQTAPLCFDNTLDPLWQTFAEAFDIIVVIDVVRAALQSSSALFTGFGPTLLWRSLCQKLAHPSHCCSCNISCCM